MSTIKDYYFEQLEAKFDSKIAEILGISDEELSELDWELHSDYSDDGVLYGHRIEIHSLEPEEIINKIVGIDEFNQVQLGPWELLDDESNDALEWELNYTEQFERLCKQLNSARIICNSPYPENVIFDSHVMLLSFTISVIENYLSSTFIKVVTNNEQFKRNLIERDKYFQDREIKLSNIYKESENIDKTIGLYLKDFMFQRIDKVKPLFKDVLNVELGQIPWLFKSVQLRHDCAHRAGLDKNGDKITINNEFIMDLINKCIELAESIEKQIK